MQYLCLDTNIPLLDVNNIIELGAQPDTVIVLPETVLDELDSKKSGRNELAYQARSFGRLIAKCPYPEKVLHEGMIISKFVSEGINIWIVALTEYPTYEDSAENIINDRKIIEVALQFEKYYQPVTFISNDVMCRIRANSLGLAVKDFKMVDRVDYTFTKSLEVSEGAFSTLHNRSILEVDPDYVQENYNYKFTFIGTDQMKIATIRNGKIIILGKETENELRVQDVNPQGADQLLFSKAIRDNSIDLVICEASAGSGKTLVALSNAIAMVKDKTNPYTSIYYVRSSINDVEDIEEVGFLPGDASEKNAIYFAPLFDSLDFIARNRFKDPKAGKVAKADVEQLIKEKIEKMLEDYHIQPITGLGMRGRTFKDCIFIYDEIQNASKPSTQKALTRIGKNCKVILIGSNKQIDHPNLTKYTNGLSVLLKDCATGTDAKITKHVVPMHRIVRSDFAEYAEKLFSKDS